MRHFILPDLHGRHDLAVAMFEEAGVPTSPALRAEQEIRTVQLGDLVNCVEYRSDEDIRTLTLAQDLFDVVLVGNHEFPYFNGPAFYGFHPIELVRVGILELLDAGILQPCLLIDDILLTHAGVAASWGYTDAASVDKDVRHAWRHNLTDPLLTQVGGLRGGLGIAATSVLCGGIFWSDAREPRAPFPQIHGHTPDRVNGPHATLEDGYTIVNLDVGCGWGWPERGMEPAQRLAGCWLIGDQYEFVEVTV